jgi:dihydroflavonol-4-reductase
VLVRLFLPGAQQPIDPARRVNPRMRALRLLLGRNLDATSAKAERLLGWKARPIEDTVVETAEGLLALPR